jgi:hypothetical protein
MNAPALPDQPVTLLSIDLEAGAFAADWKHCDQVANYLARLASFARTDTFLYANLLSTVLNELLEIVYRRHKPEGSVTCRLSRGGPVDRIEIEVPVSDSDASFYHLGVADSQSANARELYTKSLLGELSPDRSIGLLELATDYGARIWLDATDSMDRVRLTVDVRLEETSFVTT